MPLLTTLKAGGDVFRDEFSLEFDGSDDHILIPEQTHSLDDTNYSYVFWVKRDATNSIHAVLGGSESASRHIRFSSDGLLAIESNTAGDEASGTLHTNDTNWHHYTVVVGGGNGTVSMYQDGKVLSVANSDLEDDWTFDRIGVEGSSREFNGKMSEIAIYNKALSASEVATLYNGREPYNHKEGVCAPNLEAWYRMGDSPLDNFSGSGNGLVQDSVDLSLGSEINSTANCTSLVNESTGTAGGWINGNGSGGSQMATYEVSTDNVVNGTHSLHATADTDGQRIYYSFSTTSGTTYKIKVYMKVTNHASASIRFKCGNSQNGSNHFNLNSYVINPTTEMFAYNFAFKASASETFFTFIENGGSNNTDFYVDSLSIKELSGKPGVMTSLGNNFTGDTP